MARLLCLEEQNSAVSKIKVDEMFCLMSDEASKVTTNYTMPCCTLAFVKLSLDILCNILLDVVLAHSILSNFDSFLLHIFIHIHSLDLGFQLGVVNLLFRHFERERDYRQRYSGNGESEHGVKKATGVIGGKEERQRRVKDSMGPLDQCM